MAGDESGRCAAGQRVLARCRRTSAGSSGPSRARCRPIWGPCAAG